ncbi:hypothetical protein EI42_02665 [Thermosporothrix hazakensis]|jgi:hypothetical protein|uniref:Uncharacterized protein n=2 Tax=Thermosporothrix TaxID=768650 RepID=A0A326U5Z2_THEHA|nr:hypothetical protein [Thermosporothrix hazakensis]PZW29371.1 hypothetical protein EI42_02665 [Thermosporothrix hazakensis]BBH85656.1 hypothetical protein KTC_04070 [Thermosporothrix sp. COM3]GCE45915.1 hypothetical protein KTH_07840 [Thermosporothrix hazakensis]
MQQTETVRYTLWAALEQSSSRQAKAENAQGVTATISQLSSGRYMLEYHTPTDPDTQTLVPLLSRDEVEAELRRQALPFLPTEPIWEPLVSPGGVRRDEDYYEWSVQQKEHEAKRT